LKPDCLWKQETCIMDIFRPDRTPDPYSIQKIEISFGPAEDRSQVDPETKKVITRKLYYPGHLWVSLEPKPYDRNRGFGGQSHGVKKNNPCQLKIPFDEFQQLQQAMSDELKDCYQFLLENDLLTAFLKRKEEREDEAEIALLEMKIAANKAAKAAEERKQENPSSSIP
jgi:hypothetical protein